MLPTIVVPEFGLVAEKMWLFVFPFCTWCIFGEAYFTIKQDKVVNQVFPDIESVSKVLHVMDYGQKQLSASLSVFTFPVRTLIF